MGMSSLLLVLATVCGIWAAVTAILLTRALDKRGLTTPFPFIGILLFRNLARYKEVTCSETGKVGPLFYSYVVPINAAWVLVLMALII